MIRLLLLLGLLCTPSFAIAATTDVLEQAKQDMHAGHYATAVEDLRKLVDKEQDNYEAWFLFGVAHVHEQQYHQAIEAFRHVIELRPKLAEPHNNLAAVYNNLGDTKAAVRELETALAKRPNYVVAEENLADLYIKLALQHYRNSLNQGSNAVIEQRYARLLKVRNPTPDAEKGQTNTDKVANIAPMQHPQTGVKMTAPPSPDQPEIIAPTVETPKTTAVSTPPSATTGTVAKTETKTLPAPSIAEDRSITGVLDALEAWRVAWSSQNLPDYFASYAEDFQPEPRFDSIEAWKAYKSRVISNKKFIDVQFEKAEVDIPANRERATISVLQHFSSNTYQGDDNKKITMKHTPQGWKIVSEVTVP